MEQYQEEAEQGKKDLDSVQDELNNVRSQLSSHKVIGEKLEREMKVLRGGENTSEKIDELKKELE